MKTVIEDMRAGVREDGIRRAGEIIKKGGLVAFPTETVYGLGANALDPEASGKIYAAKGRPSDNPLIVHIADWEALEGIVKEVPEAARKLGEAFWPGPLTMIFRRKETVPLTTTGGLETVAVRMPDHDIALALIRAGGGYIAAPSANTSGRPSPTRASHVQEDMDGIIDMIIDGGDVGIGLESTIVDFTEDSPVILRPGYLNQEMIAQVIGEVRMDQALIDEHSPRPPKAPGMKYRHYAPKAQLYIVEGEEEVVRRKIDDLASQEESRGRKAGILAAEESVPFYRHGILKVIGSREDELSISRHLFAILREFDAMEVQVIYSEAFYTPRMGQAIMNRLLKAAGHQIIKT